MRIVARLVVDYFAYAARLGASARRTAHRLSSTPSPTPRDWFPRHVVRLVTRRVALLVVDYSASRRLVVNYFASAARPGARHVAQLVTRPVVDYFTYAARLVASACRAACRVTHHRLLRLAQARRRLLHLRRASGYFGTSRGLSRDSSSTTSPMPHVRVPRHVARPVTRLIVDYSVRRDFVLRPRWLYFSHTVHRDYLSRGNTGSTSSTPRAAMTSSSGRIASIIHLD
jgi:hypothetical protein